MEETDVYGFVAIRQSDGSITVANSWGDGENFPFDPEVDSVDELADAIANYIDSQADEIAQSVLEDLGLA